jgi:hypothetical protein
MATTQEKWQEIANRGLENNFDPETRAKFDEAVDRGLIIRPEPRINGFSGASVIEPVASVLSSTVLEPVAGITGIAQALNPFAERGAGAQAVDDVRSLAFQPKTKKGKEGMQAFVETVEPLASTLIGAEKALGDAAFDATGSPLAAAMATSLPTIALEALGIAGASAPARNAAKSVGRKISNKSTDFFSTQSKLKQKVGNLLEQGSTDKITAKFELMEGERLAKEDGNQIEPVIDFDIPEAISENAMDSFTEVVRVGAPKVKKDKAAINAIKQGFDEGIIATIKGGSNTDKKKMFEMVERMEGGKKNAKKAALNRPSDIAGDTVKSRFDAVLNLNKKAGEQLDFEAKKLKGQPVEFDADIDTFIYDLDDLGVTLDNDFKLNFRGSIIEDITGAENVIKKVVNRMANNVKSPDAFELHRLKKFIDEQVTFGKTVEGLGGESERILKNLRRNIDSTLDRTFPSYDKVNTQYSDTIGALDSLQEVAGKKMDLQGKNADKAIGTLSRRLLSNAQSRINLLDSINEIERVSRKYGVDFDDDVISQVLFVDELDSVFGPVARTSFQGQVKQGTKKAADAATSKQGAFQAGVDILGEGFEKVRGINEENAFKSIKELLKK